MHPLVRGVSAVAPIIAMAILRTDKRIVRTLRSAGADAPERAVPLTVRRPLGGWRLARLAGAGAIGQVGDRYFLDLPGYAAFRQRRRLRLLGALAVILATLAGMYLLQRP